MSRDTSIEWAHDTFNPWWGCVKVSPGCRFCYANTLSSRYGHDVWGTKKPRRRMTDKYWNGPLEWNARAEREGERRRVFCASMADVFEDRRDLDPERARLWELVVQTPWLDWLLLTKRPQHILDLVPQAWRTAWPANVWAGTSVEDQRRADERIPHLLEVPAPIRFLSCEPLLGPVDLSPFLSAEHVASPGDPLPQYPPIDWIIIGGESGGRARPMDLRWVRALRDQALDAGAAPFVKQLGTAWARGRSKDHKGGDWNDWPTDLQIRGLPVPAGVLA